MFKRDDLINYLSDVEITEINMRDLYSEVLKHVDDPKISEKFSVLSSAEENHAKLVSNLKKEVMGLSIVDPE